MNPIGDYTEDYATLNFKFFTATAAGVPTTLLGSPVVSVYKGSDVAQSVAGVSLVVDFDGVTGLNNVLIDLSADAFYETGEDYSVVVTTGTVDSVSWVGRVVATFSIENRFDNRDRIDRNADLIESQRGAHTWQGNVFYVDPVNGDTHANGNRGGRSDPYDSVQDCHDNAVTDSNHDLIILVAGAAAGVTTLTEDVTISKRYLFIRGPGRDFIWTRSGNGDTITVAADGVELCGFQLETANTGVGNGIQITDADFHRVNCVWVNNTRGDGINILRGSNCQIHNNTFTDTGQSGAGQGIDIVGTAGVSSNTVIENNIFRDTAGDAIQISGGTTNNTTIRNNVIEGATAWGINIGASSTDAVVANNVLGNNSSGNIQDNGTTSVLAGNVDLTVDTIWDEVLTGATHNVTSSAGRRLRNLTDVVVTTGTAQGPGADSNQIQLAAGEPSTPDIFDPSVILLTAGTGAKQSRRIIEYDGTTKIAIVSRTWKTNPDASTEYSIFADPGGLHVNEGLAQAGAGSSITLNALASATNGAYVGQNVFVVSGVGEDQSRVVTAYNGTSKVATVNRAWDTNPDDTSGYLMLPMITVTPADTVAAILAETITAGGSNTIQDIFLAVFAMARGRITKSGNVYTVWDDDNLTALFTLTIAENERTTA